MAEHGPYLSVTLTDSLRPQPPTVSHRHRGESRVSNFEASCTRALDTGSSTVLHIFIYLFSVTDSQTGVIVMNIAVTLFKYLDGTVYNLKVGEVLS